MWQSCEALRLPRGFAFVQTMPRQMTHRLTISINHLFIKG